VIGDAGDDLSFRNLDIAYRQLRGGAEFVAMHRNPWWVTPKGFTLDAGALVAGLEFALGRRAVICGKPSPVVFRRWNSRKKSLRRNNLQLIDAPRVFRTRPPWHKRCSR